LIIVIDYKRFIAELMHIPKKKQIMLENLNEVTICM